jgi:Patatin-like phospholipase
MSNDNKSGTVLQRTWWRIRELYRQLKPCRFSLIVALIALPVFVCVAQGTEVLRTVGEGIEVSSYWYWLRVILFFAALMLWAISSWYAARVLFYIKFPGHTAAVPSPSAESLVPRLLGVAPIIIVGCGFFAAARPYDPKTPTFWWLLVFGAFCFVLAGIFYLLLVLRRKIIGPAPEREIKRLSQLGRASQIGLAVMAAIALLLLVLFTIAPTAAQNFGMGTILCLAAASWVTFGGFLVYLSGIWQFPVIAFLIVLALLFSFWNDNHIVRLAPPQKIDRLDVLNAFDSWYALVEDQRRGETHPLYIVATEGGGIRAAYWTAAVLGEIQDKNPNFAAHLFAISGVSGGSLGAAVFEALLAEPKVASFKDAGTEILAQDFLSPTLAAMLYPDLVQRFIPWPFAFLDRGRALELGWEKAWRDKMHNDRFSRSFLDLWSARPDRRPWMPALFLNGTSVEKGNRIIASNLRVTNFLIDAQDAAKNLSPSDTSQADAGCHIPLSTAAHMSARFTFVSPAGRFPDGSHIVDGGYFENSGAIAAYEIATRIKAWCRSPIKNIENVDVKVIMISNDPRKPSIDPAAPAPPPDLPKRTQKMTSETNFLGDVTAPINALMNTRNARGTYAQKNIALEQRRFKADMTAPAPVTKDIIYFRLRDTQVPLPLGWMLSAGAAEAMRNQLQLDDKVVQNDTAIKEVLKALPPAQ